MAVVEMLLRIIGEMSKKWFCGKAYRILFLLQYVVCVSYNWFFLVHFLVLIFYIFIVKMKGENAAYFYHVLNNVPLVVLSPSTCALIELRKYMGKQVTSVPVPRVHPFRFDLSWYHSVVFVFFLLVSMLSFFCIVQSGFEYNLP